MTNMTPAARAREVALSVEAKKHALRQQQDGCWIMTLRVHQNDMPEAIMKAAMGTRYMLALVEIGDDEQPVSRPVSQAEKQPGSAESSNNPAPIRADKERRQFSELAPSQQAGIVCGERAFRLFLAEKFPEVWTITDRDPAASVREICKVNSRADIKPDNADWSALALAYWLWKNHPEHAA